MLMLLISASAQAQRYFQPLGRMYDLEMQHNLLQDTSSYGSFSAMKPVLIPVTRELKAEKEGLPFGKWMKKHFLEDDFLHFESDEHEITVNPIFDFQRTYDRDIKNDEKIYFLNTRGFDIFGRLGKRVYFKSEFYENQARYPRYEDSIINVMGGIPGQGFAKSFKGNSGDRSGKDWGIIFGSLSVNINKNMTVTLGNGKNFVGSGYRSVVLSDVSFSYPYLRTDLKFGNFYYYVLWAYMQSDSWLYFTRGDSHYKYASYHVAGWKPTPKLEMSIIEGVMWDNTDKNGLYKYSKPNAQMFVPVMLLPMAINGFNADNRVQIGYDINYSPIHNLKFYHQYNYQGQYKEPVTTDMSFNQKYYGFQFGVHWFDLLFGAVPELKSHAQFEFNQSSIAFGKSSSDFWNYGYPTTTLNVVKNSTDEIVAATELLYKHFGIDYMYQKNDWSKRNTVHFRYFFNTKTRWNLYVTLQNRDVDLPNSAYNNRFVQIGLAISPLQNFYFDF